MEEDVDGHAPALGEHGDDADQQLGQEPLLQLPLQRAPTAQTW